MGSSSRANILGINIANLCILVLVSTLFPLCDAINRLNRFSSFDYSDNIDSYGSPTFLPLPSFNSIAPQSTQPTSSTPLLTPPTITIGKPSLPAHSPVPNPSPPKTTITSPPPYGASPPKQTPSPPKSTISSPPPYGASPPKHSPSPPKSVPSPPPPSSHHKKPSEYALWCVAKPTVPHPIVQFAMDYACGSGADCKTIQPNGSCFQPNTLLAHASYAFNSYWQNTKISGGTCDFGGTAMLVTVDPSYDKCNYMLT